MADIATTAAAAPTAAASQTPAPSPVTTSLLAGLNCIGNTHLIIGATSIAATRCTQSLSAGANPILLAPEPGPDDEPLHHALQRKIDDGMVRWEKKSFEDEDLFRLGREEVGGVVDAVFVTSSRDPSAAHISSLCKKNRILVNVLDSPALCTLSLLSTHTDGPLQIGVTTNGRGCKLASRIRREIASSLPPSLGSACARLGDIRKQVQAKDGISAGDLDDSVDQGATFNKLVGVEQTQAKEEAKGRRMRWLSQVCEYWPLKRLAAIADEDVATILNTYPTTPTPLTENVNPLDKPLKQGKIILAGSGPGHPDLLTRATHNAILTADLILADKLVPAPILDLIPRRTPVSIARKFPGNADAAQAELLSSAYEAFLAGKTVLRLKQGDPFIYGRGGEEVLFFKERGIGPDRVKVLPGITSALSAPLFAGITSTQRDVADQILICTGTGKKGKPPSPPEFTPTRTVVFLMALHRISGLVAELTAHLPEPETPPPAVEEASGDMYLDQEKARLKELRRDLWPMETPCAVIERASCPDQRVIRTTLKSVVEAIETEGSRPPGLLVVGKACEVLVTPEEGKAWTVEEGFRGLDIESSLGLGDVVSSLDSVQN